MPIKKYNDPLLTDRRRELRRNQTEAEKVLWGHLRNKKIQSLKFWRQYSVGPFIVDFYCPSKRLAIELDGGHHSEEASSVYDQERTDYLNGKDIRVIRFWNNEVLNNIEGVLNRIEQSLLARISS